VLRHGPDQRVPARTLVRLDDLVDEGALVDDVEEVLA
jgi:hypothetical protein